MNIILQPLSSNIILSNCSGLGRSSSWLPVTTPIPINYTPVALITFSPTSQTRWNHSWLRGSVLAALCPYKSPPSALSSDPLAPHSGLLRNVPLFQVATPLPSPACTHTHTLQSTSLTQNPILFSSYFPSLLECYYLFMCLSPLEHKLDESRSIVSYITRAPILRSLGRP